MNTSRRKLIPITAVGILTIIGYVSMNSAQAFAQGQGGGRVTIVNPLPLPVTGNVNVVSSDAKPIIVKESQVQNAFSIAPLQISQSTAGAFAPPDPSGTKYAITSITLDNSTDSVQSLALQAVAVAFVLNNSCSSPFNLQASAPGPTLRAPAQSTVQLTFPQPFIIGPVSGTLVCLVANGSGGITSTWSAVGFKILP